MDRFKATLVKAVAGCNELGIVPDALVDEVKASYHSLTRDERVAAWRVMNDGLKVALNAMDIAQARAYQLMTKNFREVQD